jgi:cation diffusion facilitator CzcD-associated flavoprotein CzcO
MRDAAPLPTFSVLGINQAPENIDATKVASDWLALFAKSISSGDIDSTLDLFIETCYWRDLLAFTWNFRTLDGPTRIKNMLKERLGVTKPDGFSIKVDHLNGVQNVAPDLLWVQSSFLFETEIGHCSGIVRLVPLPSGTWKCHCLFTNLEDLKGFPEKLGHHRDPLPNHGKWLSARQEELEFKDHDPPVVIIGGGQSGLTVAARLKCLGVQSVIVEKNPRIGDNWRNRYQSLCLHDPVWYDHMAYMPFPPTWPAFTPALKLANWLENYAETMELNVWTSSEVLSTTPNMSNKWDVVVNRNGKERTLHVNHVIFASGLGGGTYDIPKYPGMDKFKGQILHSMQHDRATDHAGKKVVIVGACTSAHDIAVDYADHGVDVTMHQRGSTYIMSIKNGWKVLMGGVYDETGPPSDVADRLNASFGNMMRVPLYQAQTKQIADLDKELLDDLTQVGFKVNMGIDGTGFALLAWDRAGGYYLDVGASQYIIDGKVKLKGDSPIKKFTATGLEFENGSTLDADVVMFATGVGNATDYLRKICGDKVADNSKPIWGLDDEGEIKGCWRDLGLPGLWFMLGNLALVRFHSKHVALQIKAMEEGLFGTRYDS